MNFDDLDSIDSSLFGSIQIPEPENDLEGCIDMGRPVTTTQPSSMQPRPSKRQKEVSERWLTSWKQWLEWSSIKSENFDRKKRGKKPIPAVEVEERLRDAESFWNFSEKTFGSSLTKGA